MLEIKVMARSQPVDDSLPLAVGSVVPLGEQAYERLRNDIVQCSLLPGAEVTEAELSERCKLGKAPIRVALTRLTQDGLVRPVPRRGYLVTPITIKDVQDLFDLRAVIEPALCRLAVGRIDVAQLRTMESPPVGSEHPDRRGEHLEWNHRFHTFFASGSGNTLGADMLSDLLRRATRVTYLGLYAGAPPAAQIEAGRKESRKEHSAMLSALARGDPDEVERLVRKHVETSRRLVLSALVEGRSVTRL
jgi:DNA-binding GntR family transcriptional regulator